MFSGASDVGGASCLYKMEAHGVRFAPTCERGHQLVIELLERFALIGPPISLPTEAAPITTAHRWDLSESVTHDTLPASTVVADAPLTSSPEVVAEACAPEAAANTVPPPVSSHQPTLLSELAEQHLTGMARTQKHPRSSALLERKYVLKFLQDLVGDKPLADISVDDANTVADALAVWPTLLHNLPDYRDVPPKAVVAKARREKPTPLKKSTQAKHILGLRAFFHWCQGAGAIEHDPFRFISLTRYKDIVPRKKQPFSAQDIRALFHPDRQRVLNEPHKYWVPLIALYSGMRVNEISQLYLADIKADEAIDEHDVTHVVPYFDVTPFREGQSVKTGYSHRRVPIHSKLIELGFLRYVEEVRASDATHLFPGLPWGEGGPGRSLTRWFNRKHLRQHCGIKEPDKTLHCFRHTLTTLADRAKIPASVIRSINGHSDGQGIEEKTYVARAGLLECQRALEMLPFPELTLDPCEPGRFATYLAHSGSQVERRVRAKRSDAKGTVLHSS